MLHQTSRCQPLTRLSMPRDLTRLPLTALLTLLLLLLVNAATPAAAAASAPRRRSHGMHHLLDLSPLDTDSHAAGADLEASAQLAAGGGATRRLQGTGTSRGSGGAAHKYPPCPQCQLISCAGSSCEGVCVHNGEALPCYPRPLSPLTGGASPVARPASATASGRDVVEVEMALD